VLAHVPCFETFGYPKGGYNTKGGGIVGFDWGRWLWVSDCNESIVDRNGILGVVVETTAFGFGGGGNNAGVTFCVDWTIWFGVGIPWRCWWIVTEKIAARNDTTSFWED
jgi:hypothetical protein